jgi:hypothetical protein
VVTTRIGYHTYQGRAADNLVVVHEYDACRCHRLCTLSYAGGEFSDWLCGTWSARGDIARFGIAGQFFEAHGGALVLEPTR